MHKKNYTEVIMYVYPRLLDAKKQVEKKIYRMAINSFSINTSLDAYIEKMLNLIEIKNKIDRLYYLITQVLKRLDDEEKAIFNYKYFKYRSIDGFCYGSRNYYRKQKRAFERFNELLRFIGLDEETFYKIYGNLKCVKIAKENISKKQCKISSDYIKEVLT